MSRTLDQWLEYQLGVHARGVDLGLERVGRVWRALGARRPAALVIAVAGTNGKGSTVAFLEAILTASGYRVGAYTSPHILAYNERIRIAGGDVDDATLVGAFERIEAARGDVPLTYFEFGTLAALLILADAAVDVALLEVGLGGRLDAVNLVDADAAIVTTIALDHQDWLGSDRDAIGREKAGIARAGRPLVIAERDPPQGLLDAAATLQANTIRAGIDYDIQAQSSGWLWRDAQRQIALPMPQLSAPCQPANAAGAIAVLQALAPRLPVAAQAIARGVATARIGARLQRARCGRGELVVDVAHNPQAAEVLAQWLQRNPCTGKTYGVFGALTDKDVAGIVAPLATHLIEWHLIDLSIESERGRSLASLRTGLAGVDAGAVHAWPGVAAALNELSAQLGEHDRVVAFGSFLIAAAALRWLEIAMTAPTSMDVGGNGRRS